MGLQENFVMKRLIPLLSFLLIAIIFLSDCQSNPYEQSKGLYTYFCANCHMEDGTGLKGLIPPLKGADYVKADPLRMACMIRQGMEGPVIVNGITYNQPMPAIREDKITAFEITNIINYINQAWGNDYGFVKYEDVKKSLEECGRW